jgi:hypothetical protein
MVNPNFFFKCLAYANELRIVFFVEIEKETLSWHLVHEASKIDPCP